MKKTFLFFFLPFCALTLQAQEKGSIEFGFGAGIGRSGITNVLDAHPKTVINIGLSADYYFSPAISLEAKVVYDQKGWDNGALVYNNGGEIELVDTNFDLKYLTIPITANWHFGKSKNWMVGFGPYLGLLLSAKDTTMDTDLKDTYFESTDFGLTYNFGYKFPVTSTLKVFFEFEGQSGLTEIFKPEHEYSKIATTRYSLNAGIAFML